MRIFFWIVFFIVFYTHIGYPLTVLALSAIKKTDGLELEEYYPTVSIVIPVHNEEKTISDKIKNSLSLEYPAGRLRIVIVSDCSTDRTNEIVKEYESERLRFIFYKERKGKLSAIIESLNHAEGEILIFSDADTLLEKDAIKNIVKPFEEKNTGAVSGNLEYYVPGKSSKWRNLYWAAEQSIRFAEAKLGALCFVSGPFWAMRRRLFPEHLPLYALDDTVIPMHIVKQGYRVTIQKKAIARTMPNPSPKSDFISTKRNVNMALQAIFYHNVLLNFFRYPLISFSLLWHKIMRWLTLILLLALFLANSRLLSVNFYKYIFMYQAVFYMLAIAGFFMPKLRENIIFLLPFYTCLNVLASLVGFWRSIFDKRIIFWQTPRV